MDKTITHLETTNNPYEFKRGDEFVIGVKGDDIIGIVWVACEVVQAVQSPLMDVDDCTVLYVEIKDNGQQRIMKPKIMHFV